MSATTSPPGPSPHLSSPYDLTQTPSSEEDSWQYLDYSSSGSVGVLPSPASGSLNGYAVVGYLDSPHYLDLDQPQFPTAGSMSGGSVGAGEGDGSAGVGGDGDLFGASEAASFLAPQHLLFTDAQMNAMGFTTDNMALPAGLDVLNQQSIFGDLDPFRPEDIGPWDPTSLTATQLISPALNDMSSSSPDSLSPLSGASRTPPPTRKIQTGKVEKKTKKKKKGRAAATTAGDQAGRFVIMTPTTITAQAGRPNPFECFEEALRTSHKGRKGPLANATKESALQVRRLGACFCCHSRKVKCDMERPCRNCVRLAVHVPQVICWQFQDFQTVLFPAFVRAHFGREEMARFMEENVGGFGVDGGEEGEGGGRCSVELFSGPRFRSVLVIPGARFFKARTSEALTHWHLHATDRGAVDLQAKDAVPIGLDPSRGTQREEVKKRAKEYVRSILAEPAYADQLTETFRDTALPRRILQIVQRYWMQSESMVVRKALSVYTLHYILTRHLCMTRPNIISLSSTNLVPQHVPWVTPRVLNRQVKAVMDDLMQRETQSIFDLFSKNLKPKSRKEWAPCLAAFLVLCLFMESVETAADNFVVAQNEIRMRGAGAGDGYGRDFALGINEEIEKLPFRQFAYQFHQVYQTHSKDSSARAFNPLVDDEFVERGEVDAAGAEMVEGLRELLEGPGRDELDDLAMDPILPNHESHPYPRDVAVDYTGRLASRFLLSFTDEKYIFDQV